MSIGAKSLIAAVATVLALTIGMAMAQEKPPRATRSWQAFTIDEGGLQPRYTPVRLNVIDTEGVCLYVAREWYGNSVSIAAVPKTQLPPGTGCQ